MQKEVYPGVRVWQLPKHQSKKSVYRVMCEKPLQGPIQNP